jgi:hypothetical protein
VLHEAMLVMAVRKAIVMWLRENVVLTALEGRGWTSEIPTEEMDAILNNAGEAPLMVSVEDDIDMTALATSVVNQLINDATEVMTEAAPAKYKLWATQGQAGSVVGEFDTLEAALADCEKHEGEASFAITYPDGTYHQWKT